MSPARTPAGGPADRPATRPGAYHGPAELDLDSTTVRVTVDLRDVFQPLDGQWHWYGRVAAEATLDRAVRPGREVLVRTPTGEARGRLRDRDPWGRLRLEGTGRAPYGDKAGAVDDRNRIVARTTVAPG